MNTIQTGIIALIKSGITGEKQDLPTGFTMEDAYNEIMRHGIAPLAYTGAVNCGIPKTDAAMQKLFAIYIKQMLRSEAQMTEVDRILKELGFTFKSTNPHEYTWISDSLYLELHTYMFSFTLKDFYRHYDDGWQLAVPAKAAAIADAEGASSRHEFKSPEDEFIYLFTHYAKHYRLGVIGLRHLTDLWVFRSSHSKMNDTKIIEILAELKLDVFYRNTIALLSYWFEDAKDTPADSDVPTDPDAHAKSEFMSDYIFASGNWGTVYSHSIAAAVQTIHDTCEQQYNKKRHSSEQHSHRSQR